MHPLRNGRIDNVELTEEFLQAEIIIILIYTQYNKRNLQIFIGVRVDRHLSQSIRSPIL